MDWKQHTSRKKRPSWCVTMPGSHHLSSFAALVPSTSSTKTCGPRFVAPLSAAVPETGRRRVAPPPCTHQRGYGRVHHLSSLSLQVVSRSCFWESVIVSTHGLVDTYLVAQKRIMMLGVTPSELLQDPSLRDSVVFFSCSFLPKRLIETNKVHQVSAHCWRNSF